MLFLGGTNDRYGHGRAAGLGSIRSYLDAPYYVYPDGELAAEAFRVIGEAMEERGWLG